MTANVTYAGTLESHLPVPRFHPSGGVSDTAAGKVHNKVQYRIWYIPRLRTGNYTDEFKHLPHCANREHSAERDCQTFPKMPVHIRMEKDKKTKRDDGPAERMQGDVEPRVRPVEIETRRHHMHYAEDA